MFVNYANMLCYVYICKLHAVVYAAIYVEKYLIINVMLHMCNEEMTKITVITIT